MQRTLDVKSLDVKRRRYACRVEGPPRLPIGLQLTRTARLVHQGFERAMAAAGASASTWQVLLLVRSRQWDTQSSLASALGVTGATVTHHLNALDEQGLVRRSRDTGNRRTQQVELTAAGEALFERLREVARGYDEQLQARLGESEVELLAGLLERLGGG
jgi:MarR family transcriptional regulator for hemolysin